MIAYEAGYRTQPKEGLSFDLTGFFNKYQKLLSNENLPGYFDATSVPPELVIPKPHSNKMYGTTGGIEVSIRWKVTGR